MENIIRALLDQTARNHSSR